MAKIPLLVFNHRADLRRALERNEYLPAIILANATILIPVEDQLAGAFCTIRPKGVKGFFTEMRLNHEGFCAFSFRVQLYEENNMFYLIDWIVDDMHLNSF